MMSTHSFVVDFLGPRNWVTSPTDSAWDCGGRARKQFQTIMTGRAGGVTTLRELSDIAWRLVKEGGDGAWKQLKGHLLVMNSTLERIACAVTARSSPGVMVATTCGC